MQTPLAFDPIATPHPVPLPVRPMCSSGMGYAQGKISMTEEERNLDLLIADLETENRLLRARNERLEREASTIEDFKHRLAAAIDAMPFGDTAASFAVYIRDFK